MTICRHCSISINETPFVIKKGKPITECRKCNKEKQLQYRQKNQIKYNKLARTRRHERKIRAIAYKGGKCADCSNAVHPAAFDFHHIDPSQKDTDPGLMMGCTDEKLFAELDKCLLLCSNCHRIRHFINGY